jgi:hypothetical protein
MISYPKKAKAPAAKEYVTQQKSSETNELAVGVCVPVVLTKRGQELLGHCCRRHVLEVLQASY